VDFSHGKCLGKFFFILPHDLSEVAKIVAGHLNGQNFCHKKVLIGTQSQGYCAVTGFNSTG